MRSFEECNTMCKNVAIVNVPEITYLRMKILCSVHGITMANLLEKLINREWDEDKTIMDKVQKRKIKRIIKRW